MKIKSLKQKISILMLIVMLINMIPMEVFAIDDGFVFEDSNKTILEKYRGNSKNITIPKSVKVIKYSAFKDKGITSIKFNEGLEKIEEEAFSNNKITGDIVFPSSLKAIKSFAFSDNQIEGLDFSKTKNLQIEESAFQDNKISGKLDLSNLSTIPKRAFWNNQIKELVLSESLTKIDDEALANNKLSNVSIPDNTKIGKDILSGNGKYVAVDSNVLKSEKSEYHQYGFIVNPVDIEVRYLEEIYEQGKPTGKYKSIINNKKIKFDPYSEDNFFALNEKSELKPDKILNYTIDIDKHKNETVVFTPNKNNFMVDVVYKKIPNPSFESNIEKISSLLENKKEGDDISKDELLSLVSAFDYKNIDISTNIEVSPGSIINADAKTYDIFYSVKDKSGRTTEYKISLPIATDPMKIKIANTEWQLGDFVYDNNAVIGLSDKGKEKAKILSGIAIPHINPYTMESIEIVAFGDMESKSSKLENLINKEGSIIFGDSKSIKKIDSYSFDSLPINGTISNLSNLEIIGDNAFHQTKLTGSLPKFPNLIIIGDKSFYETDINGEFPDLPNVEVIGEKAFEGTGMIGSLPEMPNVKKIDNGAFAIRELTGAIPDMPKLEYIGSNIFESFSKISGPFPNIPNIKHIGNAAFSYGAVVGEIPDLLNVEYIGESAFSQDPYKPSLITGPMPNMPKLKRIDDRAFAAVAFSSFPEELPNLEYIGNNAFESNKTPGRLPEMPKLEVIGKEAFTSAGDIFFPKEFPNLRSIGRYAFCYSGVSGELPYMPEIKVFTVQCFSGTNISGEFPNFPKLYFIDLAAFSGTNISGTLPPLPNLSTVYYNAFEGAKLTGLSSMPKLSLIERDAFADNPLTGAFPNLPKLSNIRGDAFKNHNFDRKTPIMVSQKTTISDNAFKTDHGSEKMVILTDNGLTPSNIRNTEYHVVNPKNIKLIIENTAGDILFEKQIAATDGGDNVQLSLPVIDGYFRPEENITVNLEDIADDTYRYVYKTYGEHFEENNKNKYQFDFTSSESKNTFNAGEVINSKLYLSTTNETPLQKGKIELHYNEDIYNHFFIPKSKGVKDIKYSNGLISIYLDENLSQGTEIGLPVSFEFKKGVLPEKPFIINALLMDNKEVKGYDFVEFTTTPSIPSYKSVFSDGDKQIYKNILVEDPNRLFQTSITLNPNVSNFTRDFKDFTVSYDPVYYQSKYSNNLRASFTLESMQKGWKNVDEKYVYKVENFNGDIEIPPLVLTFDNPLKTEKSIIVNSELEANVNTTLEDHKHVKLTDVNEINIFPEERSGYILGKNIRAPHFNGRHSYFYDNIRERTSEFKWELTYNVFESIDQLIVSDHKLDKRMKYTSIDPNGYKVKILLKDKYGDILETKIANELFEIDEVLQEKVSSIDLIYYNLQKRLERNPDTREDELVSTLKPIIGTKLRDPNKNHFTAGNPDNINKFYNHMSTKAIYSDGSIDKGSDFAFTDILADNLDLKTEVSITSKAEDLSYGKISDTEFKLRSKDIFKNKINHMQYTALIDPAHRVEDIILAPDVFGVYDMSKTNNGYTKIDFNFNDINVNINNAIDSHSLFTIKTTPVDKSEQKLKAYGFLHSSDEYNIYGQGSGVLENLDKSKFSYDEATAKIINGEFLSIRKLIGKDDYVGSDITTKPGEKFFYRFEIDNGTTTTRENFELIDILPFEDDNNNSNYHNTLDVEAARNIKLPTGFKIQYLNQSDFTKVSEDNIIKELSDANWSNTPASNTKAIKITGPKLEAMGNIIQIDVPMKTKTNLSPIDNNRINTNRFAYTHNTLGYKQSLSNPVTQKAEIPVPKRDIKLKKVSMFMNKEDGVIEGVPFALLDHNNNLVQTSLSDKSGIVLFNDIPISDYTIREMSTPKGYKDIPVEIDIKAEELNSVKNVYDIGKVKNYRVDNFDVLLKNVEVIDDLSKVEFNNIKYLYSKEIIGGTFEIINETTGKKEVVAIDNKIGKTIQLNPGNHTLKQIHSSKDNGLDYKHNLLEYKFKVDKFGKVFFPEGNGTTGEANIEQQNNIVHFPNTVDYKTSTANVVKKSDSGELLSDAKFELINVGTGETQIKTTNSDGNISFSDIKPGLYNLKEVEAPNGYIKIDKTEVFEVPLDKSKTFNFEFENKELRVNINKYKVIASNIIDKKTAEKIAAETESSSNGKIIIKKTNNNLYEIREVWQNNRIIVDGKTLSTDTNGSVVNVQNTVPVNGDSVLTIENMTKIPGHYEPDKLEEHLSDYIIREDFDGLIEIDIEVKPLKGSIYVSKYIIDKNDEIKIKESVNGSKYALHVNKGNGYELLEESTISNNNYTLFKDLNPLYKYKVIETFVPDGQEDSEVKEYNVELNDFNRYTATVIFRNKIPANDSFVSVDKVDGTTGQKLSDVEFTIIDKHGVSQKFETDSNGQIVFEDLKYDLAPFTIRETKAKDGYRISNKDIIVTEEDLDNNTVFTVENYKSAEAPETGTFGKLPFVISSLILIVAAYILRKRKY